MLGSAGVFFFHSKKKVSGRTLGVVYHCIHHRANEAARVGEMLRHLDKLQSQIGRSRLQTGSTVRIPWFISKSYYKGNDGNQKVKDKWVCSELFFFLKPTVFSRRNQ